MAGIPASSRSSYYREPALSAHCGHREKLRTYGNSVGAMIAGWVSHPLGNAALSRRTHIAAIDKAVAL